MPKTIENNAAMLIDTFAQVELENAIEIIADSVDSLFDDIQSRAAHRDALSGTCFRNLCLDF